MNKLERYRRILIKILEKHYDTDDPWYKRLYSHQEARIWRMIRRKYPDIVILDEYTIRQGDKI